MHSSNGKQITQCNSRQVNLGLKVLVQQLTAEEQDSIPFTPLSNSSTLGINFINFFSLLSTHGYIGYYSFLFFFVIYLCMVEDISTEDKACSIKFCTVVYWRRGQGISHFGELCFPDSSSMLAKHRIGMCGYMAVFKDGHNCYVMVRRQM